MASRRIAVIGAGACGLAAIKACKEESLEVVCFEKSDHIGGLWHYSEDKNTPSVMKSTVINTSKDLTAFSDFPPSKDLPPYMHNTQMLEYFRMYAEVFELYPHILYQCEVMLVDKSSDYDATGNWIVKVRNLAEDSIYDDVFNGVMICTGHHQYPRVPEFKDQDKFLGRITHTQHVKTNEEFRDLRILVVGIGNSAVDVAVELSSTASQVFLSTNRGGWIAPKSGYKGIPFDAIINSRFVHCFKHLPGWWVSSLYLEKEIQERFDHSMYGLKPKHRFLSQHSTTNDFLQPKLISGSIVIKGGITAFTEDGVIFENEVEPALIDVVILGTGYYIQYPYLPEYLEKAIANDVPLYKYVFLPRLQHPSLAFIGLVQPHGCIFPLAECQSRWYALLMSGKVKLPEVSAMERHIRKVKKYVLKRYVHSPRHTVQVDIVDYMDQVADEFGAKPNLLKYFFTDPKLFCALFLYPCSSYQYRLKGPHNWSEARHTILTYPERSVYPLKSRNSQYKYCFFHPYLNAAFLIIPILQGIVVVIFLIIIATVVLTSQY